MLRLKPLVSVAAVVGLGPSQSVTQPREAVLNLPTHRKFELWALQLCGVVGCRVFLAGILGGL